MKRSSLLMLAAFIAGMPATSVAQDFPARQMTIIVPFAPGGSADIVARIYAQKLVAKLHTELKDITATPDIQQCFTGMGLVPIDSPPVENLQRYVVSEIERWGKVIRAAGIEASQ
jgi:tripartite-type tricarboxylate transporter receptor subunit TctC